MIEAIKRKDNDVLSNLHEYREISEKEKIYNKNLLFWAIKQKQFKLSKKIVDDKLISKDEESNRQALYYAITKKCYKIADYLYENNYISLKTYENNNVKNKLFAAAL